MHTIQIIAKRELRIFFDSLIAYILLIFFLGFSGFFTWLYGNDVFLSGQANLRVFFEVARWTLFFFIPLLTMGLLAEEKKSGTIEILLTKSVTDRQVVLGKFSSTLLLIFIALSLTFPYIWTVSSLGNLDWGATLFGYFALLLMSAAYISIGIYASSLTDNQIVAALTAFFISLFFQMIFNVLGGNLGGFLGEIFTYLSMYDHFESLARGVMDSRDMIYFLSISILGLFLAEVSLSKRNIIS